VWAAYQAMTPTDQAELERLVGHLELDPRLDGRTKFAYATEAFTFSVYIAEKWAILYRLIDNHHIEIWAIRPDGNDWRQRYLRRCPGPLGRRPFWHAPPQTDLVSPPSSVLLSVLGAAVVNPSPGRSQRCPPRQRWPNSGE